jgi:hypothetical protein
MSTTPRHAAPVVPLVDRFLSTVRTRKPKHTIDNQDYVEMLWRMLRGLEWRAIDDPQLLPQVVALGDRLTEMVDVTIAANADRYAVDARYGASMAECGRILGYKSKQVASQHRAKGKAVMAARVAAGGAIPFAERKREVAAITAAAEYAAISLADYRARRAS